MKLDDASQLSHTAKYFFEMLEHTITKIEPWNLCNGCHLLNLTIKDICLLPEFREIITFMSCLTYTMEHFNHQCAHLGIHWGLEYIGNTCFGTIYWSAMSVQCGLPAFAALAESNMDIMGHNALFMPGGWKILFELVLSKLLQHEEDFWRNEFVLDLNTIEHTHCIANNHFNELVNKTLQSHDLYITAFELNLLAVPTITISWITGSNIVICSKKPPWDMVACTGLGLQHILKHEYDDVYEAGTDVTDPAAAMKLHSPALSKYAPYDALQQLCLQFKSYISQLFTVTWLNSPHWSKQEWHHYNWDDDTSKAPYKPLVSKLSVESNLPLPGHRPPPLKPVNSHDSELWDIISSAPRQSQQPITPVPNLPTSSSLSQLIPRTSAWKEWE
ncbi:hypothetical protein V8B97DRAFT_2022638 [Scleroderma yunnanense]